MKAAEIRRRRDCAGRPADRVESIMIEINKKLFMAVATFKRKPEFGAVRLAIDTLMQAVADRARTRA